VAPSEPPLPVVVSGFSMGAVMIPIPASGLAELEACDSVMKLTYALQFGD